MSDVKPYTLTSGVNALQCQWLGHFCTYTYVGHSYLTYNCAPFSVELSHMPYHHYASILVVGHLH